MGRTYVLGHGCISKIGETKSSGKVRAKHYAGGVFPFVLDVYRGANYKAVERSSHKRLRKFRNKEWLKRGHREVFDIPPAIAIEIVKQEAGMKPYKRINFSDIAGEMASMDWRYRKPLIDTTWINWPLVFFSMVILIGTAANIWMWTTEYTWDISLETYFWRFWLVILSEFGLCIAVGYFGYLLGGIVFCTIHEIISQIIRRPFLMGKTI